ncbi:hypothetical protein N7519_006922 [Penicillium mononematosum]|uniref:uncharacterized protein n=1 Tax=Penicillium mononematosum TaxID=268346 RepID=UPI0025480F9A|nr:uncharacterized protein N7519_006922 [Penicillium mononematosum]KAJ6185621.1 hypothetical protein N7519_006922 [Penicillium mononematosum]
MPTARSAVVRPGRKTRSGCFTCKSRHVKCDEQKPSCLRCVATQRICEGYPAPVSRNLSPDCLSDEERRAFSYFRSRTAHRIFGLRDASNWISILLQLGYSEAPVKHALTALASFHESQEPVDACASIRRSEKQAQIMAQMLALKHYTAAIKSIQTESPNMSSRPDITMTLCLLFICFEQFRSGDAACLLHLTAGLRLLYWWRYRTNAYNKLQEYSRPTLDFINNQITPTFQRLRVQFSICMDSRHTLINLGVPLCLPSPKIPPLYPSLDSARNDFDREMNYVFSYLERDQQNSDGQLPSQPPITVLHLYFYTCSIIAETYHSEFEGIFDHYTDRFQTIVDLAESVTEMWKRESQAFSLLFSFDLGITPPMFLAASRCRHPFIRRKAVSLMLQSPFYHGAWQDRYSGLCAQRMIEIEEQNVGIIVDHINVTENQRIRKVSADLQEEGSQIMMRFIRWPFAPDSPVCTTFVPLAS